MDILISMGIDATFFIQFGVFTVVFIVLLNTYINPFYKAYLARMDQTEGSTEQAGEMNAEIEKLADELQDRTQALNKNFNDLYQDGRKKILNSYNSELEVLNSKAESTRQDSKAKIHEQLTSAKTEAEKLIPEISTAIVQKMMGKS